MKTYPDLLNKLQEYYDKSYNAIQAQEIQKYLENRSFPISGIEALFDLIIQNETYIPKINKLKEIIDKALKTGDLSYSSGLHPESPLQQLYKHKDKTAEKILSGCRYLRGQQKIRDLKSYEISYLAMWEKLQDVKEEYREIAKNRIVDKGDRELIDPADLKDLYIELKPIKVEVKLNEF